MGAHGFWELIAGKDLQSAINLAIKEDRFNYGHDPYTGTLSQKSGAVEVKATKMPRAKKVKYQTGYGDQRGEETRTIPAYSVLGDLMIEAGYEGGKVVEKLCAYVPEAERYLSIMDDKWADNVVAVELTGTAKKAAKERMGLEGTHNRIWVAAGTAAC